MFRSTVGSDFYFLVGFGPAGIGVRSVSTRGARLLLLNFKRSLIRFNGGVRLKIQYPSCTSVNLTSMLIEAILGLCSRNGFDSMSTTIVSVFGELHLGLRQFEPRTRF